MPGSGFLKEVKKFLGAIGYFQGALILFSVFATLFILARLFQYSNYGIDFTDESFYLVWISNPFLYKWSVTQFGYVYHPLHNICGGSIGCLRAANVGGTFFLACILCAVFFKTHSINRPKETIITWVCAIGFATASFLFFNTWLLTPSYNSLTFQAFLIASIGFLLSEKNTSLQSNFGWLCIGVGGGLAFLAKPPAALGLALMAAAYLSVSRKITWRGIFVAAASALVLLLISIFLIDASLLKFIDRLQMGMRLARELGGNHTLGKIIRIDSFTLPEKAKLEFMVAAVLMFFAVRAVLSKKMLSKAFALFVSGMLFLAICSLCFGVADKNLEWKSLQGMQVWSIVFSVIALCATKFRSQIFKKLERSHWSLLMLFLLMPHVYAIGSNQNHWKLGSFVGIFWLLGGLVFLFPIAKQKGGWGFVLPLVLGTQLISSMALRAGIDRPYRQPQPLNRNNHEFGFGLAASKLVLSDGFASYLESAKSLALRGGFYTGTPMLDLTGKSPGVLYALGAQSIGLPWMIGGYPGSGTMTSSALGAVDCEKLTLAWLLVEPGGPRSLEFDLLKGFGVSFPRFYSRVASWYTVSGVSGFSETREQVLYKPIRVEEGLKNCRVLREGNS